METKWEIHYLTENGEEAPEELVQDIYNQAGKTEEDLQHILTYNLGRPEHADTIVIKIALSVLRDLLEYWRKLTGEEIEILGLTPIPNYGYTPYEEDMLFTKPQDPNVHSKRWKRDPYKFKKRKR